MRVGTGWKRAPLGDAIACGVLLVGMAAAAEQRTLRLGEMELAYDATRWRAGSPVVATPSPCVRSETRPASSIR